MDIHTNAPFKFEQLQKKANAIPLKKFKDKQVKMMYKQTAADFTFQTKIGTKPRILIYPGVILESIQHHQRTFQMVILLYNWKLFQHLTQSYGITMNFPQYMYVPSSYMKYFIALNICVFSKVNLFFLFRCDIENSPHQYGKEDNVTQ